MDEEVTMSASQRPYVHVPGQPMPKLRLSGVLRVLRAQGSVRAADLFEAAAARVAHTCVGCDRELIDPIFLMVEENEVSFACPWCAGPEVLAAWEAEGTVTAEATRAASDRPIRASDIYLAKGFQWGGPDGPGPGSDPIRDVMGLIMGARTGHAVTDLDALPPRVPGDAPEPVLVMGPRVLRAFVENPRVVAWFRAANTAILGDPWAEGLTVPGLCRFRIEKGNDGDVVACDEAGVEVARLHGAWQ